VPKQNTFSTGIILVLGGSLLFQAWQIRDLKRQIAASHDPLKVVLGVSDGEKGDLKTLAAKLDAALKENQRLRQSPEGDAKQYDGVAGRVRLLKETLDRLPEQRIPELAYATDADWYSAVGGRLETADDFRAALARIRSQAEKRFAEVLEPALLAYMDANNGTFPRDVSKLQPFFGGAGDPAALLRYRVVPAIEIQNVRVGGDWAITQVSVVDPEFDSHIVIGPHGFGSYSEPH
jgi:hypothetical protein